jgi:hypothetical protein
MHKTNDYESSDGLTRWDMKRIKKQFKVKKFTNKPKP